MMAVLRLLMSLALVETQSKASDPAVALEVVEGAAAEGMEEVVEDTEEVVEGMEVEDMEVEVEGAAAAGTEAAAAGMEAEAAGGVIVVGSRGIWPGTVHKEAAAEVEAEGMVVEAEEEEEEVEGATTVAGLVILLGSVLIVDVDFRVWSGNSKKETWFSSSLCFLLICFHLLYLCFCI